MKRMKRLTILILAAATSLLSQSLNAPDVPIVERFDKNADGWLNAAERQPARDFIRTNGLANRNGSLSGFPAPNLGRAPNGDTIPAADVKTYPNAPFYDESVLRTLFFTFESRDWERELQDFHGTDVEVPAALVIDGKTYRDVGVRFRGLSSYRMTPETWKRSLNVAIDMAHDGQNVGGYRTLNLLNAHEDPTFMRSVLYLHIARAYVPAPKANLVRVVVNGEHWGIFANVQQFNKEFVQENFAESGGARWKAPGSLATRNGLEYVGDNIAAYQSLYQIKSKEDPQQWAALLDLCRTLNLTPAAELETALSPMLDIDGALRFLAIDNALVNNDGYWTRGSDYSLYRDQKGKFHIIPHDTSETFALTGGLAGTGGGPMTDPLVAIRDPRKPLLSKLLAVPAFREKYLAYVRDIATKWLDWQTFGPLVENYKVLIEADVKRDTKKITSYEEFLEGTTGTHSFKTFAAERSRYLLR
jgi:hypothetical protein